MSCIHEIYEMIEEELYENLKHKGVECVNTDEVGKVTDILKDLVMIPYYKAITDGMEESGNYVMDIDTYKNMSAKSLKAMEGKTGVHYYTEMEKTAIEKSIDRYAMDKSLENLEHMLNEIAKVVTANAMGMDANQKTLTKSKLTSLVNKI